MTGATAMELFSSDFLRKHVGEDGHAVAKAGLAGDRVSRSAFADWLEEWFTPCLALTFTLNDLRAK
jgi:hypothetical protein